MTTPRPNIHTLYEDPLIYEVQDFISEAERRHFLSFQQEDMARAHVAGIGAGEESSRRTNAVRWLVHGTSPTTLAVADRAAALVGIPRSHAESFQLIRYLPGQEYQIHYDAFDPDQPRGQRNWQRGGQRLFTVLVYLNAVEEGGTTSFPRLNLVTHPAPGKALVFQNCYPHTTTRHPDTLHSGDPVKRGIKLAFNLWFREQPISTNVEPPASTRR